MDSAQTTQNLFEVYVSDTAHLFGTGPSVSKLHISHNPQTRCTEIRSGFCECQDFNTVLSAAAGKAGRSFTSSTVCSFQSELCAQQTESIRRLLFAVTVIWINARSIITIEEKTMKSNKPKNLQNPQRIQEQERRGETWGGPVFISVLIRYSPGNTRPVSSLSEPVCLSVCPQSAVLQTRLVGSNWRENQTRGVFYARRYAEDRRIRRKRNLRNRSCVCRFSSKKRYLKAQICGKWRVEAKYFPAGEGVWGASSHPSKNTKPSPQNMDAEPDMWRWLTGWPCVT